MKFSIKFAIVLPLLFSLASLAGVSAQTSSLTSVSSPTTNTLNSVFLVNNITADNNDLTKLDAWAVGDSGTIVRWNGNSWATATSPTTLPLYSVFLLNASYGWAVGGSSNNGVILRYNGTWSVYSNVTFTGFANRTDTINATLYSVSMSDNGTVAWAVGAGGMTLMYSDGAWYGMNASSTNNLRSVGMIHNATEAWAVGDKGTIVHWTGTAWENMTSPTTANLNALQMINATNALAAGGTDVNNGSFITLSGTTWTVNDKIIVGMTTNTTSTANATIYSITMNNASSAWAVGANGLVSYYNGTHWSCQADVVSGSLRGVSMVHGSSNGSVQAWAVGDAGKIIAFNGTNWIPEVPMMAIPLLLSIGLVIALLGKAKMTRKRLF